MPPVEEWESFPFQGEFRLRALQPPAQDEKRRHGEDGVDCRACERASGDLIWEDASWQLIALGPTGLPVVLILEPKEHYDIERCLPSWRRSSGPCCSGSSAPSAPPATSAASTSGAGARAAS